MATIVQEASGAGSTGATFGSVPTGGNLIVAITSSRDSGPHAIELGSTGSADPTFTTLYSAVGSGYDDGMGVYIKPVDSSQQMFRSLAYRSSKGDRVYLFEINGASITPAYSDYLVAGASSTLSFDPGNTPSVPADELVIQVITWDSGGGSERTFTHTGWTTDLDSSTVDMRQHVCHQFGAGAVVSTAYSMSSNGYNQDGNRTFILHLADTTDVEALFSATPLSGSAPLEVQFTDASTWRIDSLTFALTLRPMPSTERIIEIDGRTEVDTRVVRSTSELIAAVLPELDLGAKPLLRWCRTLAPGEPEPAEGWIIDAPANFHGGVLPDCTFDAETGWQPDGRPTFWLHATRSKPDTVLHELRHLWQRRHAPHLMVDHYEGPHTPNEVDADAWAREMRDRLVASRHPAMRNAGPLLLAAGQSRLAIAPGPNRHARRAAKKRK